MILRQMFDCIEEDSIDRVDFIDDIVTEFLKHDELRLCYFAVAKKHSPNPLIRNATTWTAAEKIVESKKRKCIKTDKYQNGREIIIIEKEQNNAYITTPKKRKIETGGAPVPSLSSDDRSTMCLKHTMIAEYRFEECDSKSCNVKQYRNVFSKSKNRELSKLYKQLPNASVRTNARKYCDDVFMENIDLFTCYDKMRKFFDSCLGPQKTKLKTGNRPDTPEPVPEPIVPMLPSLPIQDDVIRSHELIEKKASIIQKIKSGWIAPVQVVHLNDMIGYGVFAKADIPRGSFLFEYKGELIDKKEADEREAKYEEQGKGCYMMYFHHKKLLCIDATDEKWGIARLVNHRKEPNNNIFARKIVIDSEPKLCMFNCQLIRAGEELRHDYGDRSRKTIDENPWLEE